MRIKIVPDGVRWFGFPFIFRFGPKNVCFIFRYPGMCIVPYFCIYLLKFGLQLPVS